MSTDPKTRTHTRAHSLTHVLGFSGITGGDDLYDPDADAEDEVWVNDRRARQRAQDRRAGVRAQPPNRRNHNAKAPTATAQSEISEDGVPLATTSTTTSSTTSSQEEIEVGTDAILSCPLCFLTVCVDCQRYVAHSLSLSVCMCYGM